VIQLSLGSFGSVTLPDERARSLATPSSAEMVALDTKTIEGGVSGLSLMERAGAAVAAEARTLLPEGGAARSVVILCGPGNNGGDGLVVARLLQAEGVDVTVVVANASRYSPECLQQATRLSKIAMLPSGELTMPGVIVERTSEEQLAETLARAVVIVDALLGTGQREAPRGDIATLIRLARAAKSINPAVKVLSVDIPTGVCADTGRVFEPRIVADLTLSIELIKRGMMQFPAREGGGAIKVAPIGIEERGNIRFSLALGENLPPLPARAPDAHKGNFGKVLLVGGSAGMPGASALAALGALRAGAPLVTRVTRQSWMSAEVPVECMHAILPGDLPYYSESDSDAVLEHASRSEIVVLGPGLGREVETGAFTRRLIEGLLRLNRAVVIDADALYHCARERVSFHGGRVVTTPHPGEAALMLERSTGEIQGDRFASIEALQERYGGVALLKGAGTLVYDGACGRIIPRGTPYLATGGSGDVLSGIIAACLCRGLSVFDAAIAGAYVHGVAGERASAASGGAIIASDIAWAAASALGELER